MLSNILRRHSERAGEIELLLVFLLDIAGCADVDALRYPMVINLDASALNCGPLSLRKHRIPPTLIQNILTPRQAARKQHNDKLTRRRKRNE